uniref:Chemosensory protein CSP6 n=1 Tax=Lobesia botrana TaxID=209534 RepID=A0A345BEN0_9NEOP|nr:chemosensory protein CSP6 [Lobesia botrana]
MKVLVVLSVLMAVGLARPDGDHYDSKYDDFDVQTLIDNPRLLKAYTLCLLSKGSCTAEGSSFKKILPEAVATTCGKCTPKQRVLVRTVIKALQEKLPQEWQELVKLHDPEGKYKESFGKFLTSTD